MPKADAYRLYLFYVGGTAFLYSLIFTVMLFYYAEGVGMNPLQLVLTGTALEIGVLLFEVPTGVVADMYSRRLSIIIGIFITGLAFLLTAIPQVAVILFAQALWGFGFTFTSGATDAWITDEIGETAANRAFVTGTRISLIGALLGVVPSVALGSISLELPILTAGGLFLLMGLILVLFMPETGFRPREQAQGRRAAFLQTLHDSRAMLQKRPVLFNILLIGFVFGAFSEGYDRLWAANLSQNIGLPALNTPLGTFDPVVWFGIIRVTGMLLGLLGTGLVQRYLDMSQLPLIVRALRWLTGGLFLALVTLSISHVFWVAVLAICLIGMLRETIEPLYKAWINQGLESSVRATVFSMAGQADAIGQLAGGPGIGAIATLYSMGLGMFFSSLLLSPALWLFGVTLKAERETQALAKEGFS